MSLVTGLKRYRNVDLTLGAAALIESRVPRAWVTEENAELAACALVSGGVFLAAVLARQLALKSLLAYHGWMYEAKGSVSLRTKLWSLLVRVLVGSNPRLNSYQMLLPFLPVPPLDETVKRVSDRDQRCVIAITNG